MAWPRLLFLAVHSKGRKSMVVLQMNLDGWLTSPFWHTTIDSPQNDATRTSSSSSTTAAAAAAVPNKLQSTDNMCYHCFDVLIDTLEGRGDYFTAGTKRSHSSVSSWNPFRRSSSGNSSTSSSGNSSSHNAKKSKRNSNSNSPLPFALPDFVRDLPDPAIECPLFITWEKSRPKTFIDNLLPGSNNHAKDDDNNEQQGQQNNNLLYELRGCIGSLSAKPLLQAIGDYAINSALRDERFQPIHASEIPHLRVAVSLLVQYEPCDDCFDWTVGKHGIVLRFWAPPATQRNYSATYLPEVALDQQWNQKETVLALMRKAGYVGQIDDDLLRKVECTRYQSSKRRMTFEEYVQRKKQQQQQQHVLGNTTATADGTNACHKNGDRSVPSTEPSSASSSFYHADTTTTTTTLKYEDPEEPYQYANHPPKQWNTCNNL